MSGTGLLTSDYGIAPDPVSANAQALGAPPINLSPRAVAAPPKPKEPESNLALARQRREQGENPSRDPNAKNPYSSAAGADQIIDGTWLKLMNTYHPEMVQGQTKEQILAMRTDKDLSGAMAGKYDEENAKILASNGIAPTPNFINALYRAGPGDGLKLIQAARQNPAALVKDIAPALATPGNNGAGDLTVGQFLVDPYQHGPGAQSNDTPQQAFTIAKGNEILAQMLNDQTEGKKELARVSKDYKPIDIPPMPKPPEVDPLSTFSSLAGVFATLAAGFSRTPAIAAMNGLAGAMHAAKESKWEDYKAHYEQFKTSSELAFKAHEQHSADVRQALEMMTKNMAAGSTMLNAVIALSDDQEMHKLHQAQEYREMARLQDQRDDKARELKEQMPVAMATADLTAAMENLKAAQKGGDQTEVARATELVQQAENKLAGVKRAMTGGGTTGFASPQTVEVKQPDGTTKTVLAQQDKGSGQWVTADGSRTPIQGDIIPAKEARSERDEASKAPITDEAADFAAGRVLAGDERATVGMARSNANITKVTNSLVRLAKQQGVGPGDLAVRIAQFQGTVQAERTLGTRTVAMEVPANEVAYMAPLALQASENVDRTRFPDLNSIILSGEKRTGDEKVVQFGLAANSLIYTYAKFLNPTGIPTDSDKARATEILSTAWSKGQFRAAIDQIKREIESGRAAVRETRGELAGGLTSQTSGASPGASVPKITTDAEYHALPSGSEFLDPNGVKRKKP